MSWPIRRRSISLLSSSLPLMLVAWGCSPSAPSGGGGGGGGGGAATVTAVAVAGNTTVSQGDTTQLQATATMSDGTTQTVTTQATWESSATAVATISSTGVLTAVATGTVRISASYQNRTGSRELTVQAPRFRMTIDDFSVEILSTCDDFTQGLTEGEFAVNVTVVDASGREGYDNGTPGYPGDPDGPRVLASGRPGQSNAVPGNITQDLEGEAGRFLRVGFRATEWDSQVVILPPSIRNVRDSDMNDRSTSRTHSYSGGAFGNLGANTLVLGSGGCSVRLHYSITAVRQ